MCCTRRSQWSPVLLPRVVIALDYTFWIQQGCRCVPYSARVYTTPWELIIAPIDSGPESTIKSSSSVAPWSRGRCKQFNLFSARTLASRRVDVTSSPASWRLPLTVHAVTVTTNTVLFEDQLRAHACGKQISN